MLLNGFSGLNIGYTDPIKTTPSLQGMGLGMTPPDPGDDDKPVPVTTDIMTKWNKLIDYAKTKGYAGKPELDHDPILRQKVFDEYNKANPNDAITPDLVLPIQNEIQNYKKLTLDNFKNGKAIMDNGVTPDNFMKGISQVDGIFGQKTSQWKFPSAYILNKQTGEKKNVGFAPKVDLVQLLKNQ